MTKIFRRDNLVRNVKPKERVPDKRRKKNIVIAFRVTPEENELIRRRVELSGLKKQDYYLQAILGHKTCVVGNVRTFDAIWKRIEEVDEHLQSIQRVDELDPVILRSLENVIELLDSYESGKENLPK